MKYCSACGAPVSLQVPPHDERPRYVCKACDTVHYRNPTIVVGCIPEWEGRLLLCRRNIKPRINKWTLPAGYLENDETVTAGARRETWEETGAVVENLIPYRLYDIVHVKQVYLMFRSGLRVPEFKTTHESSEVRLFKEEEIPWDDIAFPVIEETLRCYFRDRAEGTFTFQVGEITKRMSK